MNELDELVKNASRKKSQYPCLRWGQALFNQLEETDKGMAAKIRGTDADPFYDDAKVDGFFNALSGAQS